MGCRPFIFLDIAWKLEEPERKENIDMDDREMARSRVIGTTILYLTGRNLTASWKRTGR
jgi:hypothetical protein